MSEVRGVGRLVWPLGVAVLLLAMMATCCALWWIAAAHPDALVVEEPWAAERVLSEEVHAVRRARELGLSLVLETSRVPAGLRVRAHVADRSGLPRSALGVRVRRERPAEGGLDVEVELAEHAGGWTAVVPLPRGGRWRLVAQARTGAGELVERQLLVEWSP